MSQKTNKPVWNVIYYSSNEKQIKTFNVFDHLDFLDEVQKHLKNSETREECAKKVRSSLMYYFWCKYEWEIIIQPWGTKPEPTEKKVDVAWQVLNNWERFEDYVWSLKQKRRKATDKSAGENDG